MNIIVDTNIIFSGILTPGGKINELLINKPIELNYFSPKFLLEELERHKTKILKITGFNDNEYQEMKNFVLQEVTLVPDEMIAFQHIEKAHDSLISIDVNDSVFLALAFQKDAYLWTGDKKLIDGLHRINYKKVITTSILYSKYQ